MNVKYKVKEGMVKLAPGMDEEKMMRRKAGWVGVMMN